MNVVRWTSWNIKKINHFVYVNVMSWTSCRGRLETFTLVELCFFFNQSLRYANIESWSSTSWHERRAVNILKYKKINHFVYVNVMSWTSCRGRLETFTLVEMCFEKKSITLKSKHRVVIVMSWTSCRERFEIFTLVEQFFLWKKNQSLRYMNIELWS